MWTQERPESRLGRDGLSGARVMFRAIARAQAVAERERGGDQAAGGAREERRPRAGPLADDADERAADRGRAPEGDDVERDDAAAPRGLGAELEGRVGRRGEDDARGPGDRQEDPGRDRRRAERRGGEAGGEDERGDADGPDLRRAAAGQREACDDRTGAHRGVEEAEAGGAEPELLMGEQRDR